MPVRDHSFSKDCRRTGQSMINVAQPKLDEPLDRETNPFGSGTAPRWAGSPVQIALGQVIRHIELGRPVIIVAGRAGTGKTLLMDMIARACSDMRLSARQIDRGDLATALDGRSDVLLVDEADSIP